VGLLLHQFLLDLPDPLGLVILFLWDLVGPLALVVLLLRLYLPDLVDP
jgi:hypothetical protein